MSRESLLSDVERYYTAKLNAHGPTPLGVDWNGPESQAVRFERLLRVLDGGVPAPSLNDYGCGYGGLFEALAARFDEFSYHGYDVSGAMLEAAHERHGSDPRAHFVATDGELPVADFTVASGICNVRLGHPDAEWHTYVLALIDRLGALSRHGMAFNALTSHSDPERMRPDLYYADPAELLDYCLRRHTRDVRLYHDYELYEFTVVARLDGRPPVASSSKGGPGG